MAIDSCPSGQTAGGGDQTSPPDALRRLFPLPEVPEGLARDRSIEASMRVMAVGILGLGLVIVAVNLAFS